MFCEAYVEVAGWISVEPLFTVSKDGTPYCRFSISTTNNTRSDNKIMKFNCFVYDSPQYRLLKQMNLTIKDEVVVKGMFSAPERKGDNGQPFLNLCCYVNYIKVIRSAAAEKAKAELNAEANFTTNIPVRRQVNNLRNQAVDIDKDDKPWEK